ncbi:MAG: hypothetical protein KAI44_03240 [Methylococcales bacterium]|nr:hypothetical protein [Methylococcales bacterium]
MSAAIFFKTRHYRMFRTRSFDTWQQESDVRLLILGGAQDATLFILLPTS